MIPTNGARDGAGASDAPGCPDVQALVLMREVLDTWMKEPPSKRQRVRVSTARHLASKQEDEACGIQAVFLVRSWIPSTLRSRGGRSGAENDAATRR
jgi:hypothetical protein